MLSIVTNEVMITLFLDHKCVFCFKLMLHGMNTENGSDGRMKVKTHNGCI